MLRQLDTLIGFAVVMSVVSLLITIVTQIVSSVLGLRGKNLADALEVMIHKIYPDISKQNGEVARKLAHAVLTHPIISDSALSVSSKCCGWLKRASAIRPDELVGILREIAGKTPSSTGDSKALEEAKALKDAAAKIVQTLSEASEPTKEAIEALRASLPKLAEQEGRAIIAKFNAATDVALNNIEGWFNSAQDRAKQWFAMHTRIVTVMASIVAAFVLQLDCFSLLQRISSDPELRSRLVAASPALQAEAQKILNEASPSNSSGHSNVLAVLEKSYPGIGPKLRQPPPNGLPAEIAPWIQTQLSNTAFSNQVGQIAQDYQAAADEGVRKRIDDLGQRFGVIHEQFNKSGLQLLPDPYPDFSKGEWSWPLSRLLGILASAALLSLGAPFWFNTLKSFSNLRPMLAQQIDKKPKTTPSSEG